MKLILLLVTLICAVGVDAQTNQASGNIDAGRTLRILPDTARYQLVPLSVGSVTMVRLDRFSGKTFAYDYGRRRWVLLTVRGGLPAASNNSVPKFELYFEGQGFLINTETGQTWVLFDTLTWEPITD